VTKRTSASNSEDESQATAGVGLAQGKIAKFCLDRLFFQNEGIVTIALLGFLRGDGMASQVTTIGIIPIKKRRWLLQNKCTCVVFTILNDFGGIAGKIAVLDGLRQVAL
jgi:hypothetical protein